jgi:hypothetical protein
LEARGTHVSDSRCLGPYRRAIGSVRYNRIRDTSW